jgi:tight adherence protein B
MIAVLVVVGFALTRAAVMQARRSARTGRVVARAPRRARGHLILSPPRWFLDAVSALSLVATPVRLWRWSLGGLACGVLAGLALAGPVLAALAAATWLGAPHGWNAFVAARRDAAYDASLATALDAMARAVRGGGSLQAAVGEAANGVGGLVGSDLHRIAASVQRGVRFEAALTAWRTERDRASVHLAVGAIALAAQTGGPPARVIEDVAASLRMRMQIENEARSLGAQARLSAIVVGVAPIGFALVACAVDSRNASLMFGTPIGVACLILGLGFDVAGAVWMHRISQTVLR